MKTLNEIKNDQNNYGKNGLKVNDGVMYAMYDELYEKYGSTFTLDLAWEILFDGLTDVNVIQMKNEFISRMCNHVVVKRVGRGTYKFTDEFFNLFDDSEAIENPNVKISIPSTTPGNVYLIREPQSGAIKIGLTTKTPTQRLKELNSTGVLFDLELITAVFVNDCYGLENRMHCIFSEYRVRPDREFFMVDEDLALDTLWNEAKNFI